VHMICQTYETANDFLSRARAYLEKREAANSLVLGISLRLAGSSEASAAPPYFATIEDGSEIVLAAAMTPPWPLNITSEKEDCGAACETLAQHLLGNRVSVPGVNGPPAIAGEFARTWSARSGMTSAEDKRLRIYELRRVIHPTAPRGQLRVASEHDAALVAQWRLAFHQDTGTEAREMHERLQRWIAAGDIYLWEDGRPVSMAARTRPTVHGIAIGSVYTPPELRRHGYATACVAALSQLLLDSGYEFCVLFADLANPTSNHIYQDIGYRPVCDFATYRFTATP